MIVKGISNTSILACNFCVLYDLVDGDLRNSLLFGSGDTDKVVIFIPPTTVLFILRMYFLNNTDLLGINVANHYEYNYLLK